MGSPSQPCVAIGATPLCTAKRHPLESELLALQRFQSAHVTFSTRRLRLHRVLNRNPNPNLNSRLKSPTQNRLILQVSQSELPHSPSALPTFQQAACFALIPKRRPQSRARQQASLRLIPKKGGPRICDPNGFETWAALSRIKG
jgi:hypothetical protein